MNADGTDMTRLTDNNVPDLTATWSPQGDKILFHRLVPGSGQQLFTMNADGTAQEQLTSPPGTNNLANWGQLKVHQPDEDQS